MLFGALDEMATNWMLSHRRSSLDGVADAVVDVFVHGVGVPAAPKAGPAAMMRTVTVLGAGTMGAQIAAHAANAGFAGAGAGRHRPMPPATGMKRARGAASPDPFFTRAHARRSSAPAASKTDLDAASRRADWVIEAVVERLDVKQALFASVEPPAAPHAIVSSNTSGIPIGALAEGRSDGVPPPLPRHALLQPAALPEAARADPDAGHRRRRARAASPSSATAPRQGRRRGAGHAELHRQPHRPLRDRADPRRLGRGRASRSRRSTR